MSIYDNNGYLAPEGVSVADNVREAQAYAATHNIGETIMWAVKKMGGGGDWDYRKIGENQGLDKIAMQDIGNFNYGAVTYAIGVSAYESEVFGGLYQLYRQSGSYGGIPFLLRPFGDDPKDNAAIRAGIDAVKNAGIKPFDNQGLMNDLIEAILAIGNLDEWSAYFLQLSEISEKAWDFFARAMNWIQPRRDPLALDLDNDGIETTAQDGWNSVLFDHNNDSVKTATGWLSGDDGFLVLDKNGNGTIDNGNELFGDNTQLSNGLNQSWFVVSKKQSTTKNCFL
jgi:hypothetical protein